MSVIPQTSRATRGLWAPFQGSALDPLGTLSGPQSPRLLNPPHTTNPGSAPGGRRDRMVVGVPITYSITYVISA
jgi:hypothetical protein